MNREIVNRIALVLDPHCFMDDGPGVCKCSSCIKIRDDLRNAAVNKAEEIYEAIKDLVK